MPGFHCLGPEAEPGHPDEDGGPRVPQAARPTLCPSQPASGRAARPGAVSLHSQQGGRGRARCGLGFVVPLGLSIPALQESSFLKNYNSQKAEPGSGNVVDTDSASPVWIPCQCQQLLSCLPCSTRVQTWLFNINKNGLSLGSYCPSWLRHLRRHTECPFKKQNAKGFGTRKFQSELKPILK